jgi:hypothetical protein
MSISEPRVEVVEESGKALLRAYTQWTSSVQQRYARDLILSLERHNLDTEIYESAIKSKPPMATVPEIHSFVELAAKEPSDDVANKIFGYYLSALINESKIGTIALQLGQDGSHMSCAAYRLRHEKIFILKKGSRVSSLGHNATGHIVNHGDVESMGFNAHTGTRINRGTAKIIRSNSGVDLNFGIAELMDDGQFQLNYGRIEKQSDAHDSGVLGYRKARNDSVVRINLGTAVDQAMELEGLRAVEINAGRLWTFGHDAMGVLLFNAGEVASMPVHDRSSAVIGINHGVILKTSAEEKKGAAYWNFGKIERGTWPQQPASC